VYKIEKLKSGLGPTKGSRKIIMIIIIVIIIKTERQITFNLHILQTKYNEELLQKQ
jgi:hypothetical protein